MKPQDTKQEYLFQDLGERKVVADFEGGRVTSDSGALLLREIDQAKGILEHFSHCFTDMRHPDYIEHGVLELLCQRVYGLALGYEDLNDHDALCSDPLIATLVGKTDPLGLNRRRKQDIGKACAGKSTMNRLELTGDEVNDQYKKIIHDPDKIDETFLEVFISKHTKAPQALTIDLDPTDIPLFGHQEGAHYHGYYREDCYLPIYAFCGHDLLWAKLHTSDEDPAIGAFEAIQYLVTALKKKWPQVNILIRADSTFGRDNIMTWCEEHQVDYILGLTSNNRLKKKVLKGLKKARKNYYSPKKNQRYFYNLRYRTKDTWSKKRRVVAKIEHLSSKPKLKFIVTSLSRKQYNAKDLYEKVYCARGDMENRIKEQQLGLFADRTSAQVKRANQLRLYFSAMAYVLMHSLREIGLKGTTLEKAQMWTIREKLLKIGAVIKISVRRVLFSLSSHHPSSNLFHKIYHNLQLAFY